MKKIFVFVFISVITACNSQKSEPKATTVPSVTFMINDLPSNHNFEKDIYISGDFEGWSGGRPELKLKKEDKTYHITLPNHQEVIGFKFTLGNWDSVERDAKGANIENRAYTFTKAQDTIHITIESWATQKAATGISTAEKNVHVFAEEFNMPQLQRKRRVTVYLPPNYKNTNKRYPVLYIHDGQNVFDKATSYAGEWQVDETLNMLHKRNGLNLIVVAIDNGGDKRMQEYTPWEHKKYGKPEGKEYIDFIAQTLKPAIDTTYRTKTTAQHTGIMGSSMGGLISHYAAFKYPNVFGKAGIFSPSFWFSKEAYTFTKNELEKASNSKFYFLMGEKEGGNMVLNMKNMIALMTENGFSKKNYRAKIAPNGTHSEAFWRSEFEEAILWLFQEEIAFHKDISKPIAKEFTDIQLASGKLIRVTDFPSEYIEPRNVDVWLPDNYSTAKKYSVLYMHDGQMLFDSTTTWNKQEWMVDEVASKLIKEGNIKDFIVVAAWNISEIRWQDYFPQKAFNYLDPKVQDALKKEAKNNNFDLTFNADNYLKFLTKELKPYIDTSYATKTDPENTFVAGSSMGGLISMYAICEYPDVFGAAACISTHWPGMVPPTENNPIPEAFFVYMEEKIPSPKTHRLYFDYGTETLDRHYPQYADQVTDIMTKKGYTETNFKNLKFEGANHSENAWQKRLHIPFTFLLQK